MAMAEPGPGRFAICCELVRRSIRSLALVAGNAEAAKVVAVEWRDLQDKSTRLPAGTRRRA